MIFCTAIASFDANARPPDDDTILTIDAGRLVAMLDQVTILMKLPDADQPPSQNPMEVLDFVVARYNVLLPIACERQIVEGPECGLIYAPLLQADPVPLAVLRREITEVQNHVLPFWHTVCGELDDRGHPICQME
ncbi:MAG: hypothetical protein ACTHLR_07115 [Rhizomicrobium sp.]